MSLAATTASVITIIDRTCLMRDAVTYDAQKIPALATPIAHAWSPDNTTLYIMSSFTIHSLSPGNAAPTMLYNLKQSERLPFQPLQPVLVVKDKSTLIFAQGSAIYLLAIGSASPRISGSLIGHSTPVISLSLSNDASLLASSSVSGTVCVHNLAHNSLTVLKGLPTRPGTVSKHMTCTFHPHIRTRLLVGCGDALVVYDTTRPSTPVKTIVISENEGAGTASNIGHVVAISCSPYTRTLIVVAFISGFLALVDLGKDRPYFKHLRLRVPVTSMTFTADGGSLALGTETGKVIVIELRDLDHGIRELPISEEGKGERVIALSIQRRIRVSPSTSSVSVTKSTTVTEKHPSPPPVPLVQHDLNNPVTGARLPPRRIASSGPNTKTGVKAALPLKSKRAERQPTPVLSPPIVSLSREGDVDLSAQANTLTGSSKVAGVASMNAERSPTRECDASKLVSGLRKVSSTPLKGSKMRSSSILAPPARPSSKSNIISSSETSRKSLADEAVVTQKTRLSPDRLAGPSQATRIHTTKSEDASQDISLLMEALDNLKEDGSYPSADGAQQLVSPDEIYCDSDVAATRPVRTPTPDLSFEQEGPPMWKDRLETRNVTLVSPEGERWNEAGQRNPAIFRRVEIARGKHVDWAGSDENFDPPVPGDNIADGDGNPSIVSGVSYQDQKTVAETRSMPSLNEAKGMPPMRRPPVPPNGLQLSPLRSPPLHGNSGSTGTRNGGAQDLLRSVVNDVMFEYRQETREDIKGLHLDLLRLGRSWKNELRTLMEVYVGDLRELREENVRLRKENERLRQSF